VQLETLSLAWCCTDDYRTGLIWRVKVAGNRLSSSCQIKQSVLPVTGHKKLPNQIASSQHQPAYGLPRSYWQSCTSSINLLPLLNSDRPAFNSIVDAS
jgi:hypothetical protein